MAKILIDGTWYHKISSNALYESDYEKLLLRWAEHLFPQHHLIPFKKNVSSEYGSARADFALIEKEYREWWIVEAELSHHSLHSHVLPQVEILSDAVYGRGEMQYFHSKHPSLDTEKLSDLVKGQQPRVLVVVDAPVNKWIEPLGKFNAMLCIVEVFRSEHNKYICRMNGESPMVSFGILSECMVHSQIPKFLVIHSPASLQVSQSQQITIRYQDSVTEWQRSDIKDTSFLIFKGRNNPLKRNIKYVLFHSEDGMLEIKAK